MGWQKPDRPDSISLQKKEAGTSYDGIYQGKKVINTPLGDSILYTFMDEDEKPFTIWGFTNLNYQMEGVSEGGRVRITYMGKAKAKNKYGKFPHQAKVEIWNDENAPEASYDHAPTEVGE